MVIRLKIAIIFLIIIIVFTSCSVNKTIPEENKNIDNQTGFVVEENKNYNIVENYYNNTTEYSYTITDNYGNNLYKGSSIKKPNITYIDKNILQVSIGAGNVSLFTFYDIEKGINSQIYENPSLIENGIIVYMTFKENKIKLVISDVFDDTKYYKEIERDFSSVASPYSDLQTAKFLDINTLEILYLKGNDYIETKEIIKLNEL